MAWCQLKTQINTTQSEVNNATAMQVLERVLSRLDHRPGSPEQQTTDDDDDAGTARPRRPTVAGPGWDGVVVVVVSSPDFRRAGPVVEA